MTVYIVGHIDITDRTTYADYEAGFRAAFAPFNGVILAADDHAEILEGDPLGTRTVLIEFPNRDDALAWFHSESYQTLAAIRWRSSSGSISLISGRPAPPESS